MERRLISPRAPSRGDQAGVAMIVALLVLVALSLAAAALTRSVNTGSQIAGNLSFRQDATANADRVAQEVLAMLYDKLTADPDGLNGDLSADGYYASLPIRLDPTGNARTGDPLRALIAWDEGFCGTYPSSDRASCSHTPKASTVALTETNAARYIVFRMCDSAGSVELPTTHCATTTAAASSTCQGAINYENEGRCPSGTGVAPYYRILVRIVGPRDTTSFTETIVHF